MSSLPQHGRPVDAVIADLVAKRSGDVRWEDGRTFGMVYDGGPEVREVAERAASLYLHENALNTAAFPSLGAIQSEVVGWTAALLHGGDTAAGFLTSGGTESILCAVKAARERGRVERGITEPEMIVAESAHAAFHKAAHLFGLTLHKVAVNDDWRADVPAMAALVNDRTVLVVGSAPQYPQGVIDDIPAIAAIAAEVDASCHVDACMGGFVLPFAEMLGHEVAPWDFRVDGVTSISADIHKLGYVAQGRVRHPAPDQGAAPLPDLRVRWVARRVLRLAEPPGHPIGAPDGGRVGGDAAPRGRGLRGPDPRRRSRAPIGCGRGSPPSRASGSSVTASSTSSR